MGVGVAGVYDTVAKVLNNGDGPEMYAPLPPPPGGVKILLTIAVVGEYSRRTKRAPRREDMVLMHIDVHRAFFNMKFGKRTPLWSFPGRHERRREQAVR